MKYIVHMNNCSHELTGEINGTTDVLVGDDWTTIFNTNGGKVVIDSRAVTYILMNDNIEIEEGTRIAGGT